VLIRRMILTCAVGLLVLVGLAACAEDDVAGVGETAVATMWGVDGAAMGTVTMEQGPHGVLISADVSGLTAGGHGFHIHAVGSCTPDFSAAGSHFGPGEESHGFLHSTDMHAGDLPNVYAHADGTARADVFTADVTLAADDPRSLFDSDGSAIIIHEKPDAYGEDVGSAGARIACGVIERS